MAYFLGKDVAVHITTEDSVAARYANVSAAGAVSFDASAGTYQFAGPLSGSLTDGTVPAETNVTGIDLSIGAVDEDITYMGRRSVTKAEIKKETTVSLTRKKSDIGWDGIFNNGGRMGCSGGTELSSLQEPTINTGYRIHVILSGSTDVFSVRGCCVQGHTVSVNADGTSEETMEFMSYITPKVTDAAVQTKLAITEI